MPEDNKHARLAIEGLGVDPDNLGCVMLDVDPSAVNRLRSVLDPEWAYHSPTLEYVKGFDGDPHVTLLYGLLLNPKENRDLIDGVLDGWSPPAVLTFNYITDFGGSDGNDTYGCLVMKSASVGSWTEGGGGWVKEELGEANARLSKLPHVRPFVDYDPHVTIGYVKRQHRAEALKRLGDQQLFPVVVTGLNYGD